MTTYYPENTVVICAGYCGARATDPDAEAWEHDTEGHWCTDCWEDE